MALSTVTSVLRRLGLGRGWNRKRLEVVRYEWPDPGDLLHVDIKKLGKFREVGHRITGKPTDRSRGVGWEFVYVCVDDASRLAYVEVLEDERAVTAADYLDRAVAWFRRSGVRARRVMTDNGSAFISKRWAKHCRRHRLRHLRTRPYTPRTNGKAERFIQTLQREWAYGKPYKTSAGRRRALPAWLRYYNHLRPHRAIGMRSPIARLRRP
jgi:transposase InsO family protein